MEKKKNKSQQGQGMSSLWLCFVTFVFGYLAASWFDVNQLSHWMDTRLQKSAINPAQGKEDVTKTATIEHPKLEFYTLLANDSLSRPIAAKEENRAIVQQSGDPQAKAELPTPDLSSDAANVPPMPMELALETPAPKISIPSPKIPTPSIAKSAVSYAVQVSSFRVLEEAQRMRAKLMMKGFDVQIQTVQQQSINWYRVMIGPFASLSQAQQAQASFAQQEHISGMIRKLEG